MILYRINYGGPAYQSPQWITDADPAHFQNPDLKLKWAADTFFTGGGTYSQKTAIALSAADTNPDPPGGAQYSISVPNGQYPVSFFYAEISPEEAGVGKRVFNVFINGLEVDHQLDVFALAGADKAYVKRT